MNGSEVLEQLNTNPWDSVVKIYLRHKDDASDPEELVDREGLQSIVLPRAKLSTGITGRIPANPYATTTGDVLLLFVDFDETFVCKRAGERGAARVGDTSLLIIFF